jgi:hypothetical protein
MRHSFLRLPDIQLYTYVARWGQDLATRFTVNVHVAFVATTRSSDEQAAARVLERRQAQIMCMRLLLAVSHSYS